VWLVLALCACTEQRADETRPRNVNAQVHARIRTLLRDAPHPAGAARSATRAEPEPETYVRSAVVRSAPGGEPCPRGWEREAPPAALRASLAGARDRGGEESRDGDGFVLRQEAPCIRHSDCTEGFFCPSGAQMCAACWKCTSNGMAVDGRCPSQCAEESAAGVLDTSPPELSWAFVDNRGETVGGNVVTFASESPHAQSWVDLYMYIRDAGSGLKEAVMFFTSTTQSGHISGIKVVSLADRDLTSGSSNAGVLKSSFWFEFGDEAGRWGLRQLQLQDQRGNVRVYTDRDFLLFGSLVNATLEIHGDVNNYISCGEAKKIMCGHKADCFQQCHAHGAPRCFGKCSCKPGFSGNEFYCMETDLLTEHLANGTRPAGIVLLPETGSSMLPDDELEGRDVKQGASPPPPLPQYASGASQANPVHEAESHINGQVAMGLLMSILLLGCLLLVQAVWRGRLIALFFRRRRRTHPAFDPEDPVAMHRMRLQAWTHQLEGRPGARGGSAAAGSAWQHHRPAGDRFSLSDDEAQLVAWVTAMSERDMDEGRGVPRLARAGSFSGSVRGGPRPQGPPQAPPPISLPAHLRDPKPTLPGAVDEELAEGSECAVCMVCCLVCAACMCAAAPRLVYCRIA
jgi:hypothetical protein